MSTSPTPSPLAQTIIDAVSPLDSAYQTATHDLANQQQIVMALRDKVANLQQQLSQQPTSTPAPAFDNNCPISFKNVEALPGWIHAKGSVANGPSATTVADGTFVYDPTAKEANLTLDPHLGAWANLYWYLKLAGTDQDTGKP